MDRGLADRLSRQLGIAPEHLAREEYELLGCPHRERAIRGA